MRKVKNTEKYSDGFVNSVDAYSSVKEYLTAWFDHNKNEHCVKRVPTKILKDATNEQLCDLIDELYYHQQKTWELFRQLLDYAKN